MKTQTSATGDKGFTLIEIIVVVVIISILATMTIPRMYGGNSSAKLRGSARRLLVTAQYARDFAATHRCQCRIIIDPDQQRYALTYQIDPQHNPNEFVPLGSGLGKSQRLDEGLTFARLRIESRQGPEPDQPLREVININHLTFEPTGQADSAVLEITDGKDIYSLLIAPYTGYAKLVEGTVSELPNDRIDLDV